MDFKNYSENTPHEVLLLDTVIGNPSGSALVTMEFERSKLLLAFLVKEKTMNCVSQVFYNIRQVLGKFNMLIENATFLKHVKLFYSNSNAPVYN